MGIRAFYCRPLLADAPKHRRSPTPPQRPRPLLTPRIIAFMPAPSNMSIGHSFAALRLAAQAATKEKAFERAEALYRELQAAYPRHPLGLVGQGQVAQMRRDWAAAVGLWEQAWERHPGERRQEWLRAKAEALAQLGRVGEAETLVGALLEASPDDLNLNVTFASLAMAARRWRDALDRWDRLLQRIPDGAQTRWRIARADALRQMGEEGQARAAYLDIVRAHPDEIH